VSLSFQRGVGTLRASFGAGRGAGLLRTLRLTLPGGVTALGGRRGLARIVATAGGKRVATRLLKLRGRTLTIDLGRRGGATTLRIRWIGLRPSVSLARKLGSARTRRTVRLTLVPRVTDTAGRGTTLRLRVRPS
jgi:hypothetical protein